MRTCPGAPGQSFINEPIEVTNCDEIILSWKAPLGLDADSITAFRIKYSAKHIKGVARSTPPADDMVVIQTISDPRARRASVRGLLPGTTYSFRLNCRNNAGWGRLSRAVYAETLVNPIPRMVAGSNTTDSIELAWAIPGGFIDVAEVQIELWRQNQSFSTSNAVVDQAERADTRSSKSTDEEAGDSCQSDDIRKRTGASRCLTVDAQQHTHCTLNGLAPGTVRLLQLCRLWCGYC